MSIKTNCNSRRLQQTKNFKKCVQSSIGTSKVKTVLKAKSNSYKKITKNCFARSLKVATLHPENLNSGMSCQDQNKKVKEYRQQN